MQSQTKLLLAPLLWLACATAATGAELAVFVTGSMVDPLEDLGEDFEHETGHTLTFSRATTGGLLAKIEAGERADVVVITAEAAAALEQRGILLAGTRRPVASSVFGVVVKAGVPLPDVATPEALKAAVLNARTISYPDPGAATVSGGYIESVFDQLGIKDAARAKAALKPMGYLVGEAVENGEAELGLSFMSEFTADDDLAVASFPDALQKAQLYSSAVFAESADVDAARSFIAFVTSAAARAKLAAAGVVPATQGSPQP